jgi:serine/threonine protein kinase
MLFCILVFMKGDVLMAEYKGDRVGQQLGPYRLTRLLGEGGFGEVYEAEHRLLQQKRAIKLLLERHFHDPNQRERFLREVRTLATLDHPNILPVLEVGEEGSVLYLVMPFYHRGTLNDLLKPRTPPLPLAEVERLLAQVCAAVGYAHARHIAHLDLKPENMLLHEDGRLVLSDFGLAHLIKQGRVEAGSSASWGTPYYMAPEHIRGQPELRSDLYALGVILYQLLTTQRPFTGTTPEAVMMKHLLEIPPPLHAASPDAPATLEPVLRRALEKRPEDRYATAEVLLADFRAAVNSPSSHPTQPPAPSVSPAAPTPQTSSPVSPNEVWTPADSCYYCGLPATGRCATCKRVFCHEHQAQGPSSNTLWPFGPLMVRYPDKCARCLALPTDPAARARAEAREELERERLAPYVEAREYFKSGSARTALQTSGVKLVEIYKTEMKSKQTLFGLSSRLVEEIVSTRRGWIIGKLPWGLTALLDDHLPYFPFTRVQPFSGGYKEVGKPGDGFDAWVEAAEAVKRLAGASS